MIPAPLLVVAGPSRSGIAALAGALSRALGWPQRDGSADLARLMLVADAARRQGARFTDIGWSPPPRLISAGMAEALLTDLLAGAGAGLVLRGADVLPDAAVLPGLAHLLPLLPAARVVLLRRHAAETVSSRLRALPRMPFAAHCLAWATAMEAGQELFRSAPGQVMWLAQEEMLARPERIVAELAAFCGLGEAASGVVLAHLRGQRPGRSGLDAGAPRPTLAELGWSTPEKAMFLDICGPAMAAAGQPVEALADAVRRAPLHLEELARDGALRLVGMDMSRPDEEPAGTLRLRARGKGAAFAVLPAIAPAGRDALRLRISALAANAPACLARIEVVGSLSRALLLARDLPLPACAMVEIDHSLYTPPDMIDVVISMVEGHAAGSGLDLQDAVLSARRQPA